MTRRAELHQLVGDATAPLIDANAAREIGLAACRRVIRSSGSAIRSIHRLDFDEALSVIADAERSLREAHDALVLVDFPDAITGGLRRTLDALRAVLERTRGDVTTTVLQAGLRDAIERAVPPN